MRLAAAVLLLALTACAEPATVREEPEPTYAADEVVLRVYTTGGLREGARLPLVPGWSLTGDGRVFTLGPQPEIYPGPAFPNVRVATVSASTVRRIVDAARDLGLDGEQRDYGTPAVVDAGTTVFLLDTGDETVETRVYALEEDATPSAARRELREFRHRLTDLNGWLGDGAISDDETYVPAAVAVYAGPHRADPAAVVTVEDVPWTGPDPDAGERIEEWHCTVLTGDVLAKAIPDLRSSNVLTRWTARGKRWAFRIRPLLPDERTCEDGLD